MKKQEPSAPRSQFMPMDVLMPMMREQLDQGRQVRFSPQGVSMLPMLRQDLDAVLLSPLPPRLRKYDLPLYRRDDGSYILHRVIEAGDTYTCMGDNQFVPERGLEHRQMIALVTAFYRNGRQIPVTHPGYRLYCILWHRSRPLRRFWYRGVNYLRRRLRR